MTKISRPPFWIASLERGRFIHLDGPSWRTRHLNLEEEALPPAAERARISGIRVPEFPEPTARTKNQNQSAVVAALGDAMEAICKSKWLRDKEATLAGKFEAEANSPNSASSSLRPDLTLYSCGIPITKPYKSLSPPAN